MYLPIPDAKRKDNFASGLVDLWGEHPEPMLLRLRLSFINVALLSLPEWLTVLVTFDQAVLYSRLTTEGWRNGAAPAAVYDFQPIPSTESDLHSVWTHEHLALPS